MSQVKRQDARNPQDTFDHGTLAIQDASTPTSSDGAGIARRDLRASALECVEMASLTFANNSPAGSPPHQQRRKNAQDQTSFQTSFVLGTPSKSIRQAMVFDTRIDPWTRGGMETTTSPPARGSTDSSPIFR
ncbi:hypothetical protein E4U34_001498 [Claviceps purpurea]|nr:hypothetical protein E4U34_001498 [Claviceps purpurea]